MIRPFLSADTEAVVGLWTRCALVVPTNDPAKDIARKLAADPGSLLVAEQEGTVVGTIMAGYEGHRGWINYLAVDPEQRRRGLGKRLLQAAEELLRARGCPKINLQVRDTNRDARAFYETMGYAVDPVTSYGKRLVDDRRT